MTPTLFDLALKAGFSDPIEGWMGEAYEERLEAFAKLIIDYEIATKIANVIGEVRAKVIEAERKALMQLFTDPENQPTQHGTVTIEYMQREIAAEREACAKVCDAADKSTHPADLADAIRARGQA
jgi:hypothetical protein